MSAFAVGAARANAAKVIIASREVFMLKDSVDVQMLDTDSRTSIRGEDLGLKNESISQK